MKPRLDELLVQRGFFANVHDAQAAVLAGEVVVGEHRETSAGKRVAEDVALRVKGKGRFASRGGEKLQAALDAFGVDPKGCTCIDLGASTGGFTDCLLQHGAARVAAVDVGEGQLAWHLRNDVRVAVFDRTNVRGLQPDDVGGPFDIAVADLSFIPLRRVVEDVAGLLREGGVFVSLVKPQFEVAKAEVGEGGIVRETALHERALGDALAQARAAGLGPQGIAHSPITGAKGNIEFLFWAQKGAGAGAVGADDVARVVREAHERLERR